MLLFLGCAPKISYESSQAYYIMIKNSKIAIADTGFIKKNANTINLQVFSASAPLLELTISENICIGSWCQDWESFNEEFFGTSHYKTFINKLLDFQPIYNKKNMIKIANGFSQKIKTDKYDIEYRVKNDTLYFKDSKNRVLIKLKKLEK
jgi:hypothetical protein